jgi:hypothetical protein
LPLYRLVERHADGRLEEESFQAPDDDEAWERAQDVAAAEELELWRGDDLVRSAPLKLRLGGDGPPPP